MDSVFFSYWRTSPGLTLLILLVVFIFQISDFYQRRMIQSSSSVEQDRSKDPVTPDSEQELEVWATFPPDSRGLRLAPASPSWFRMNSAAASRLTWSLPSIFRFW